MNVDPAHLVGTGGAVGALARYAVGELIDDERFPAATFTVNVVGSFVLALATFLGANEATLLFVGTGACGSFTTFSSFSVRTIRLWETGDRATAALNAAGTLVAAGGAVGLAWLIAAAA